jgi:hypothetical protein
MTIFHRDARDCSGALCHEASAVTVAHRCVATRDLRTASVFIFQTDT